jgi:ligand-binding sensor domain-containing protein
MCKLKYFSLWLLIVVNFSINAQQLDFKSYTVKNGLPSDEVYNLFQDKKGYIWAFTNYGAVKFNGKEFKPVLVNLPFNESFIYSFYENKAGRLWVANSNGGIYEVKNDSAFVVKGSETAFINTRNALHEIFQLYVDDSLNIYTVSKNDTYKYLKNKVYQCVNLKTELKNDTSTYVIYNEDNELIPLITAHAIEKSNGTFYALKTIRISIKTKNELDRMVCIKGNTLTGAKLFKKFGNDIYISVHDKIVKVNNTGSVSEILLNAVITNFKKDKNNHLWVSCVNSGLFEFNEKDSLINHYFIDETINDVLFDSQKGFWVSSGGHGLYYCSNMNLLHYSEKEYLGSAISFIKWVDKSLFIANVHGDLFLVNHSSINKVKNRNALCGEPLDIIKYNAGFLVAYRNYSEYFDLKGKTKLMHFENKAVVFPTKFIKISEDSLLLVGRRNIAFLSHNKVVSEVFFDVRIYDCVLRNNQLLFCTNKGIYLLKNGQLVRPKFLHETEKFTITRSVRDSSNNYWFCSKGKGVFKLSTFDLLTNYDMSQGMPSDIVNDLCFSGSMMFLSTNRGVFYSRDFPKQTWKLLYSDEVKMCYPFLKKLYLATKKGLVVINRIDDENSKPLGFNLVSVSVNSKNLDYNALSHLKHFENNLEFLFDVIVFDDRRSAIKYKLKGANISYFNTIQDYKLNFQNLSPGSYTLTVSPELYTKSNVEIVIPFTIYPAFWQTTWFVVTIVLFLIGFVILAVTIIVNYRRRKEQKKNEVEKLILEYKLVALKAQINPHFMSNCLTAIQQLIFSNHLHEANLYIAKFSFLVRQVLNFSSKSLVLLHDELEITKLNVELELLRFENKFDFKIHVSETVPVNLLFVPPLIMQPIVENAIWHGLMGIKNIRKGLLIITVYIENELLCITIEDNGEGRVMKKEVNLNYRKSSGLQITRQRILNLNNLYNVSGGNLVYEDVKDITGLCTGTLVKISLPILLNDEL